MSDDRTWQHLGDVALLAKVETNFKVDAAPVAATDLMAAKELSLTIEGSEVVTDYDKPYWGNDINKLINKHITLTFFTYVAGSGAAGDKPNLSPLMLMAGTTETVTALTDCAYTLASDQLKSATCDFYVGEDLWKLLGCRANVKLVMKDQHLVHEWTIMGAFQDPADGTTLPTDAAVNYTAPESIECGDGQTVVTLHGEVVECHELEFDFGNDLQWVSVVGYCGARILGRNPSGSMTIVAPTQAEITGGKINWHARATANEALTDIGALNIAHGSAAGKQFVHNAPKVQIGKKIATTALLNDMKGLQLPLNPLPTTGDDDFSETWL